MASATRRALNSGALVPLSTKRTFIDDDGVHFLIYVLKNLQRKKLARQEQRQNPFLPYDKDLFVGEVSPNHVLLLNKFNVLDDHLLLVTREFESQERLLTPDDFAALLRCMAQYEGLAFYNGGEVAGASQQHKHLQLVPLPPEIKPLAPVMSGRFPSAFARLDPNLFESPESGAALSEQYGQLLQNVGLVTKKANKDGLQAGPYNLLFTREWMFVVARSKEHFASISINSLGFVGSLLVRNEEELKLIEDAGPMKVLSSVVGVLP